MFETTHWTLVNQAAARGNSPTADIALEQLCSNYWKPVYNYVYHSGKTAEEAKDLTQDFFLDLLRSEKIQRADRLQGRFRNFLITCLKNFLTADWRKSQTQKRGGQFNFVRIDDDGTGAPIDIGDQANLSPEEVFDYCWAKTLIKRAIEQLKLEWERDGKPFDLLLPFLTEPKGEVTLVGTAQQLGISLSATKSAIYRLRQRFGKLVREEVAKTVTEGDDIDQEVSNLLDCLNPKKVGR